MADDKNLELKSVIAKFNQSSSTLDSLTEKLSELNNATNEISRAEKGIAESHLQVKRVVDEIMAVSVELRKANTLVRTAIESVATFLNATELGTMKYGIDRIYIEIKDLTTSLSASLQEKVLIEKDLSVKVAALQTKIDAVPEKIRRKLGWSASD